MDKQQSGGLAVADTRPPQGGDDGEDGPTRFDLPAVADIRVAADVSADCRSALEAGGDVRVGAAVERVDAAVLQCLAALATALRQGGHRLELVEPSPAFTGAVEAIGFGPILDPDGDAD